MVWGDGNKTRGGVKTHSGKKLIDGAFRTERWGNSGAPNYVK